jgi:transcriptional regulator with XRE-family HTH domain
MRGTAIEELANRKAIGARIALAMAAAGMSQAQLGKALGIHQTWMSKLIAGQRTPYRWLPRMATALDVSARWLEHGDRTRRANPAKSPAGSQANGIESLPVDHLRRATLRAAYALPEDIGRRVLALVEGRPTKLRRRRPVQVVVAVIGT